MEASTGEETEQDGRRVDAPPGVGPGSVRHGDSGDAFLLTEIARQYYALGRTQAEIGRDYDLDASTVSRHLKRAREEGIVRIEIRPPQRRVVDPGLGREVAARFGLKRAIIAAPESSSPVPTIAAEYVGSILETGMRLGVASWSTTMSEVARALEPGSVSNLSVAALAGGVSDPVPGAEHRELVTFVAGLYPDSVAFYLHAPLILDSAALRTALVADSSVRAALAAASQSNVGLVGIGELGPDATLFRAHVVSPEDSVALTEAGVVGSLCGHFFDAQGRPAGHLEPRTVALTWDELRVIPRVIAVAYGLEKIAAIAGALRSGVIHVLVSDVPTAKALLASER
jgi:DNA-binding transcriptional regulator LsrR (DeoR family)